MSNSWVILRALLVPPSHEDVVLIVRLIDGGRSVVQHMGGGTSVAIGQTVGIGRWALIRDGAIVGEEPEMPNFEVFV